MAQKFYMPKGGAVSIGAIDAGQCASATLTVNRELAPLMAFDVDSCMVIEDSTQLVKIEGELKIDLLSAADVGTMSIALFGSSGKIGDSAVTEYDITVVSVNAADNCSTWTYNFPRCRLADSQEHILGLPADATDPALQSITFTVLLAAGADSLGTIVKS